MKSNLTALIVVLVLAASVAYAQPIGPNVPIPGLSQEQVKMAYERGTELFVDVVKRYAASRNIRELTTRASICGVSQMMQGVIMAAVIETNMDISSPKMAGARSALYHLRDIELRYCDRPPGGDAGTGNEGDVLVKAWRDARAPLARSALEKIKMALAPLLDSSGATLIRDALLVAAVIASGLVAAPILGT